MQSSQPESTEPEDGAAIPDFARAWESLPQVASGSVRRPSPLPDPQSYHQAVEPQAIFELCEKQKNGLIETILVVPFSCTRCRLTLKQACSRTRPACARCRNVGNGAQCEVVQEGYQRLPHPKVGKPSAAQKQSTSETREESTVSSSAQEPAANRSRGRRVASRVASLSQVAPSGSGPSAASRLKRSRSAGSDYLPPRKKAQGKTASRKKEGGRSAIEPPTEMDVDCPRVSAAGPSAQVASAGRGGPEWMFVGGDEEDENLPEHMQSIPSNNLVPRVWTNSPGGLLTVFPELAKSTIGFSWFQSETPVLLLDANYARGHWIDSFTLQFDLLWDFSCNSSELEPVVESGTKDPIPLHSSQPVAYTPENTLGCEAETMGLQNTNLPPETEPLPMDVTVSIPPQTFDAQSCLFNGIPQDEPVTCQGSREFHIGPSSSTHSATQCEPVLADRLAQLCSSSPLSSIEDSPPLQPCPLSNEPPTHHTTSQPALPPSIPLDKPPEVETLLSSHLHFVPLLLWLSHDSGLVTCNLSPEYAYLCMGLFFISDLRHAVVRHVISATTGLVQGRVRWSVTLQWAPGGEDALYDCNSAPSSDTTSDSAAAGPTRDLSHPWWFDPTNRLPQADDITPYRPRDLRMQFYSFIPLDLLAEFHPSESFPRGWLCKSCGMINIQSCFRHQICESTACMSVCDGRIPPGKADPLSSFRDPYKSSALIRPTDKIPPAVVFDSIPWDDGMHSWVYGIRDGVTLCHVFTGNQESVQGDATSLLERIQCDVLLHKEDYSSPYFVHSTRLLRPGEGSETMVPRGTPDCVRTAYYTLCDFVHHYAEMDKPRFGEVRILAWINSGSKKGHVFCASKSPVVIHCLGAEVVLNLTPKGGYKGTTPSTAPDKGKERAEDENQVGPTSTEPCAGPSHHPEEDYGNESLFTPPPEATELPTVAENVDEVVAAKDTVSQCLNHDVGGIAIPDDSNISPVKEVPVDQPEVAERRVRKKNKGTKDKNKASGPEVSLTLVHGDCVVLYGDDFGCQIVRTGTTILVIGFPEGI